MITLKYDQIEELPKNEPINLKGFECKPKLAELKLSYRRTKPRNTGGRSPIQINAPERAIEYLREIWNTETLELREEFVLVCLSNSLHANGWIRLYAGGFQDCAVDVRLLLGVALQTASSAILIAHNHPSGNLMPSVQDRKLTEQIARACRIMSIRLLDHLILTRNDSYSFVNKEPELFI